MENIAWMWMAIGLALVVIELFVPSFFALFFGVSAIIVGLLSLMFPTLSLTVLGFLFSIISIISIAVFFKVIKPRIKTTKTIPYTDQVGIVVKVNSDAKTGVILFPSPVENKEKWDIHSVDDLILDEHYKAVGFNPETQQLEVIKQF